MEKLIDFACVSSDGRAAEDNRGNRPACCRFLLEPNLRDGPTGQRRLAGRYCASCSKGCRGVSKSTRRGVVLTSLPLNKRDASDFLSAGRRRSAGASCFVGGQFLRLALFGFPNQQMKLKFVTGGPFLSAGTVHQRSGRF